MENNRSDTELDLNCMLTTAEFAAGHRVSPLTVRKNLCEKGHHFGAKPIKLANRRLLWKSEDLKAILAGGSAK
ncbi:MAG: hypothetical protein Q8S55_09095 [Methylococcaceae bacterium]|nr:hypothetical protein [Methylococcaceae bacterium]